MNNCHSTRVFYVFYKASIPFNQPKYKTKNTFYLTIATFCYVK